MLNLYWLVCSSVIQFFCGQVTYQTKQLTTEFEKQSQYIICLLAELQQKDTTLLSLQEKLQQHKQELELLKSQQEGEGCALTFEGQKQVGQEESPLEAVRCEADRLTPVSGTSRCGEQQRSDQTERSHNREEVEFIQDGAAAELAALQQEQQLLQQEISERDNSGDGSQGRHPEEKNQDRLQNQSPVSALPCLVDLRSPPGLHDVTTKAEKQTERSCDEEQEGLQREDEGIEAELKAACEPEINRLQEQVIFFHQMKASH